MTFTYNSTTLDLFDHAYNSTALNERAVEIPIARQFIAQHGLDLEVGNVLGHYGIVGHRVVDRYEVAPGVENLDVFDVTGPVGTVVTISTLEHVRRDEPELDTFGAIRALHHLRTIADALLVTIPLGHNAALDAHVLCHDLGTSSTVTLVRNGTGWQQTVEPEWRPYGVLDPWAGAVWIGTWT